MASQSPNEEWRGGEEPMTKTLADMTPDERATCVGLWATNLAYTGDGESVGVIACVQHDCVWLIHPNIHGEWSVLYVNTVSPRPDLPRAWNPDGTPPEGEWVDGHMWWNEPGDDNQPVNLIGAECLGTGEMQGMDEWPKNVTPAVSDEDIRVRRFITEWEDMR